ncbi:MAG: DUF3800 domain-containing protein [Methanothrix sp.]
MDGEVIFADESGDLGLSEASIGEHPYYTVGFVHCTNPSHLRKDLKRLLKKVHDSKKYPRDITELKFYLPTTKMLQQLDYSEEEVNKYVSNLPDVRQKAIDIIKKDAKMVFAAVLDKRQAYNSWTSERLGNFVFAQTLLINVMRGVNARYPPSVVYDRGRLSPAQTEEFKDYVSNKERYLESMELKVYQGKLPCLQEMSSHIEPGIWAADIVAGAASCKYAHNDRFYVERFGSKYKERIFWQKQQNG